MLTVLQIVAAPTPTSDGQIGITGPERRSRNLLKRWKDFGIKPVICYPRRGRLWAEFEASGETLVDFEIGSKFNFGAIAKIAEVARDAKASVIHTQGPASLDLLAVLAAGRCNTASVVTRPVMIEDEINRSSLRRGIYGFVDRNLTARRATQYVAVSRDGYERLQAAGESFRSRLRLIHNGIDLKAFVPKQHSASDGSPHRQPVTLGMIGHLLDYKGWPDFIAVIRRLKSSGLNIRAIAVGEGAERAKLEELARKMDVQGAIEFRGFQADVRAALSQMDLLLFTTLREGLSVAVIEAMASNLPVVATQVGGIAEQVDEGQNGYIVPAGDVEQLSMRCKELICDPTRRATMGVKSRQIAEQRFSEDRMISEYAACYREAAAAKGL